MFRKNIKTIAVFIVLIIVAGGSWIYLRYTPPLVATVPKVDLPPEQKPTAENVSQNPVAQNIAPTTAPTTTIAQPEEQKNLIPIKIFVNAEEYNIGIPPSSTLYDTMRFLQADSKKPFVFSAKEYPGMGMFVEEINGVKNNTQTQNYWIYYIGGAPAKIGISQYVVKPGDTITWKYEKSKF